MTLIATTVATPLGPMSLLGTPDCLQVAAFGDDIDDLRDRLAASLRAEPVERGETPASAALRDYFAGDARALDRVDVRQPGGPFHTAVWAAMRAIPPGTTVSYSELAARAGAPRAARAAAAA
ncbi:MAG: MGMT family protein, partial [Candidatus Dormibacteria bacterium]